MKTLAFLIVCLIQASAFAQNPFNKSRLEKEVLKEWNHSKLFNIDAASGTFSFIYHEISGGSFFNPEENSFFYKLLKDPSSVKNNPKISASYITNLKRDVYFGRIGLILKVPSDNIVATYSYDAGTGFKYSGSYEENLKNLKKIADTNELENPKNLLKISAGYNEIVATGLIPKKTNVEVEGIAINCPEEIKEVSSLGDDQFSKIVVSCLKRRSAEDPALIVDLIVKLKKDGHKVFILKMN